MDAPHRARYENGLEGMIDGKTRGKAFAPSSLARIQTFPDETEGISGIREA